MCSSFKFSIEASITLSVNVIVFLLGSVVNRSVVRKKVYDLCDTCLIAKRGSLVAKKIKSEFADRVL